MRAAVEKQLVLIAQGQARYESILEWTLDIFKRKFKYFVENVLAMDMLFEVTFSSLADSGKPMSRLVKLRVFAHGDQRVQNHHKCLSQLFLIHLNTYGMRLRPLEIFLLLQCRDGL